MSTLRAIVKLLFGETWLLPAGVAVAVAASVLVRHLLGGDWTHVGGFVLLAGVIAALTVSVSRG
jgi:hypothetical protein